MKILVLTGAGISADSGLSTFRDFGGMWGKFDPTVVCSVNALTENFEQLLEFYNLRREQCIAAEPNAAHYALVELAKHHDVTLITQNVDDLHERSGFTDLIHLHGEITKCRDMITDEIYDYTRDLKVGSLSKVGNQLRPHIVLFGEQVPAMYQVIELAKVKFDYLIVIGTSLQVYPAAAIVSAMSYDKLIVVDPNVTYTDDCKWYKGNAAEQVPLVVNELINNV